MRPSNSGISISSSGIVAILTDFGTSDPYVGVMKGVMASIVRHFQLPNLQLIDLTHEVPPQAVVPGALHLDASWPYFPHGTVFLCVVDPGVGSVRRPVVVQAADRWFVGPDNGLFSLLPQPIFRLLTLPGLPKVSRTFHGRDLFAPAAAQLACGAVRFADVGPLLDDPIQLLIPVASGGVGEVLYIDHFGNAITNLPGADSGTLHVGGYHLPVGRTYADVPVGAALGLTGSTGRLEIAIRNGNATAEMGLSVGMRVQLIP